jgi:multimeric flavodoxin WrbA
MIRYTLSVTEKEQVLAAFRTNTYEYSPRVPLAAHDVALQTADAWEARIRNDPGGFIREQQQDQPRQPAPATSLVVIQGSPRPDGNCSILAEWAVEAAQESGMSAQVIYPHDMDIHCCIGCYQCYNTGTCVFNDDMTGIIDALRGSALVVVCSPVYTNTIPGSLKLVIDRCQAYHAERVLYCSRTGQKGLIFSVAGRSGKGNFMCVTRVLSAFLRNLGIEPAGEILIDRVDAVQDIRRLPGMQQRVKDLVRQSLTGEETAST